MRVPAQLTGNVSSAPEPRELPSGDRVAVFRVATDDGYRDASGEWRSLETCYWRCEAWNALADLVVEQFTVGVAVVVSGHFRTHSWNAPDGSKRSRLIVSVDAAGLALSASAQRGQASPAPAPPAAPASGDAEAAWGDD